MPDMASGNIFGNIEIFFGNMEIFLYIGNIF